jgi:hypothetical protein
MYIAPAPKPQGLQPSLRKSLATADRPLRSSGEDTLRGFEDGEPYVWLTIKSNEPGSLEPTLSGNKRLLVVAALH